MQGMIDWINARQAGVRRARQEVGEHNVDVLHAAEVNFLGAAMAGNVTMTNDVIPSTRCDLYSYSSWDIGFTPQALTAALDYLKSKAPDSDRFGAADVYLGEFGAAKGAINPNGQRFERIRQLLEAALGWGVRYAVYWEVFSNEPIAPYVGRPTNDDLRGYWLIRPDGVKVPYWSTLTTLATIGLYRVVPAQLLEPVRLGRPCQPRGQRPEVAPRRRLGGPHPQGLELRHAGGHPRRRRRGQPPGPRRPLPRRPGPLRQPGLRPRLHPRHPPALHPPPDRRPRAGRPGGFHRPRGPLRPLPRRRPPGAGRDPRAALRAGAFGNVPVRGSGAVGVDHGLGHGQTRTFTDSGNPVPVRPLVCVPLTNVT